MVFSRRGVTKKVYRGCFFEFEDLIASMDLADFHTPEQVRSKSLGLLMERAIHKVQNELGMRSKAPATLAPTRLDRKYEIGFAIFAYASDIPGIRAVANWRTNCRKTVCYLAEHWPADLLVPRQRAYLKLLNEFDLICCHCPGAADLEAVIGKPCIHLPVGVDALKFHPRDLEAPRPLEVFSMGRRPAAVHEALLRQCSEGRLFYVYDTASGFDVMDWREHRQLIASNIQRSEFFLNFKHNISLEGLTGGVEAVGARHFESAAGGTVSIGVVPDCEAFRENFDWPDAVINMAPDCDDPMGLIQDLRRQPERLRAVRRNGVVNSLRRHDWSHRWRTILEALDLPVLPGLIQRQEELEAEAARLEVPLASPSA